MKFIKLRHAEEKTRTYTVNVNNISCIETYINESGKVYTWLHSKDFEGVVLHVKETEDEILRMFKAVEKIAVLS